jgi:hypothetical protein
MIDIFYFRHQQRHFVKPIFLSGYRLNLSPSQMMSQPYLHQPLSSETSFRIIDLYPSRIQNAPLRCNILELNIMPDSTKDHPQPYEALSYVWGIPSGTCELYCGSGTLQLTPNCESALRSLRYDSKLRKIFVDAICIDQSSEEHSVAERNQQVKLMGEIYKQAYRTLIWLGDGSEQIQLTFKWLHGCRWPNSVISHGFEPGSGFGWMDWMKARVKTISI